MERMCVQTKNPLFFCSTVSPQSLPLIHCGSHFKSENKEVKRLKINSNAKFRRRSQINFVEVRKASTKNRGHQSII